MKLGLLGSSGYVGSALGAVINLHNINLFEKSSSSISLLNLTREDFWNNKTFGSFVDHVDVIVNCAGFAGKPNVDQCELDEFQRPLIEANVFIPSRLATFCEEFDVPLLHVSSGCIYQGIFPTGDLRFPCQKEMDSKTTEDWQLESWGEEHEPNFRGSKYSASKMDGEAELDDLEKCWIFRPRMFYSNDWNSKNFVVKVSKYPTIVNAVNSVTHTTEFCKSIIKCIKSSAPFGKYNMTHSQPIMTSEVLELLGQYDKEWITPDVFNEDMKTIGMAERSFTTLDSRKASLAGIGLSSDPMPLISESVEFNKKK
jgi:dTDP-4-dehydrorhamnose reductase